MRDVRLATATALACLAFLALATPVPASGEEYNYGDSAESSNTLTVGEREPGDVLLARKHVEVGWRFLGRVTETLTYAGHGRTRITRVEALDRHGDGNGAVASIVGGGPGRSFVAINFVSAFNRGINFVVEIYGTK